MNDLAFDQDAFTAAVDLVGRSGARNFEVGYLHDNVPIEKAGWYAHAQYQGARLTAEDQPGPVEAAEALARRILTGGQCAHCGGLVALSDDGAYAYQKAHKVDGTPWDIEDAAAAGTCRWRRMGARWARGCEKNDRAARRRAARRSDTTSRRPEVGN